MGLPSRLACGSRARIGREVRRNSTLESFTVATQSRGVGDEDCLKAAMSVVPCRLTVVEQVPSGNPAMVIEAAGFPLRMD